MVWMMLILILQRDCGRLDEKDVEIMCKKDENMWGPTTSLPSVN